jgi:hypothetical protein
MTDALRHDFPLPWKSKQTVSSNYGGNRAPNQRQVP